jgi:hypothetical protein
MIKYYLVRESIHDDFIREVERYLNDGWELQGSGNLCFGLREDEYNSHKLTPIRYYTQTLIKKN